MNSYTKLLQFAELVRDTPQGAEHLLPLEAGAILKEVLGDSREAYEELIRSDETDREPPF